MSTMKRYVNGDVKHIYRLDRIKDGNSILTFAAVWGVNSSYSSASMVDVEIIKEFDFMTEYNPLTGSLYVHYAAPEYTYVTSSNIYISARLHGDNNRSWFKEGYFDVCKGGTSGSVIKSLAGPILGVVCSKNEVLSSMVSLLDVSLSVIKS